MFYTINKRLNILTSGHTSTVQETYKALLITVITVNSNNALKSQIDNYDKYETY